MRPAASGQRHDNKYVDPRQNNHKHIPSTILPLRAIHPNSTNEPVQKPRRTEYPHSIASSSWPSGREESPATYHNGRIDHCLAEYTRTHGALTSDGSTTSPDVSQGDLTNGTRRVVTADLPTTQPRLGNDSRRQPERSPDLLDLLRRTITRDTSRIGVIGSSIVLDQLPNTVYTRLDGITPIENADDAYAEHLSSPLNRTTYLRGTHGSSTNFTRWRHVESYKGLILHYSPDIRSIL